MTKQELKECIAEVKYSDLPESTKKKVMNVLYDELHKKEWIPCSDQMPEKDGTYICSFLAESEPFVGMTTFSDGKWDEDGVVAWQLLPEAYNGEEREEAVHALKAGDEHGGQCLREEVGKAAGSRFDTCLT